MARRNLFSDFLHMRITNAPDKYREVPITSAKDEIASRMVECSDLRDAAQLTEFRTLAQDRQSQYNAYDEMGTDSTIAAALEIYADDATQTDEKGRVIWVESDDPIIADSANRLLDILEIPERAWKHIYMACKYGDYYLKFNRKGIDDGSEVDISKNNNTIHIVNDRDVYDGVSYKPPYEEYIEDIPDPAIMFDLQLKGKTAGFIEVHNDVSQQQNRFITLTHTFTGDEIKVYPNDAIIHIALAETLTRTPETVTLELGDTKTTYSVRRGKSILYDVYPIQKQLQLLEDALALNRLTRSALIRLMEIEVGDMPKKEVNAYLRRVKNLVEQHISMNKETGTYQSYQSPGPIENILYFPVKGNKGHITLQNLGGDVNIRDIADIDYFNNKKYGVLKIPKAYLGDDMEGEGLSNGGSLTKMSIRYARTIRRIQLCYIRAITTMLNLFFIDKKLDYVNKFEVKMTSPNTQEDLDRNALINSNTEVVDNIMRLLGSLEGDTQKTALVTLMNDVMKMPDIAEIVEKDGTAEEDINIDAGGISGETSFDDATTSTGGGDSIDMSDALGSLPELPKEEPESEPSGSEAPPSNEGGEAFTDAEFDAFQDTL